MTFFPVVRFSNFAADRRESKLTREEKPKGLLDSVVAATQQAEEMRLLAERGMYLGNRLPQLTGFFNGNLAGQADRQPGYYEFVRRYFPALTNNQTVLSSTINTGKIHQISYRTHLPQNLAKSYLHDFSA